MRVTGGGETLDVTRRIGDQFSGDVYWDDAYAAFYGVGADAMEILEELAAWHKRREELGVPYASPQIQLLAGETRDED